VLFQRIVKAKSENPKMRVFVVDPRRTATCDIADVFLPIKPGTDVILFNGLLNYLRREDALDWDFLDAHAEGFGAAMGAARETAPSIPAVAAACGVPETDVADLYRTFARTPRAVTVFSQGVNQSSSGTDKVNAIVNVHLATGKIGKAGTGPFSLTGQPNAMGGREVGGLANQLAAHMAFTPEDCDRVQRFWRSPRIASRPGFKAVDLFEAVGQGRVKALWIMSTNPSVSMPDAGRVRAALARCELVVVSDCVRRTDTTAHAHVLLPAAAWGEKSGTVTNSERRISRQRAFLPAPGESRPDWWIATAVARRMGFAAAFAYELPADVFREHAALSAFENDGARGFDIGALADLTAAEYDALEPCQWPLPAGRGRAANSEGLEDSAASADSARPFADGRFFTPSRKARFVATVPAPPKDPPTAEHPLILNTGRIRDQWHTMTRTGQSARLSGRSPEPFVQVHPTDAAALDIAHGDLAEIHNMRGRMIARAEVTSDVQPGQLFAPMHWSDQFASAARVGSLLAPHTDPVSGQPELKHAAVRLVRFAPRWHGFAMSREPLELAGCSYLVRARGEGFWRYEMAGDDVPGSWPQWANAALGARDERVEFMDTVGGRYRGARIVGNRLQACVFVAATKALPSRTWLGGLFAADALDDDARRGILAGRAANGALESGPVVCSCFSVGRSTLLRAIRTQALVTTDDVGKALRAGTNCGSCLPELKVLLAQAATPAAVSG
jgi:assimilatory nitrate reductase catalytic subunit